MRRPGRTSKTLAEDGGFRRTILHDPTYTRYLGRRVLGDRRYNRSYRGRGGRGSGESLLGGTKVLLGTMKTAGVRTAVVAAQPRGGRAPRAACWSALRWRAARLQN